MLSLLAQINCKAQPCSTLYSFTPVGIGTPYVESITSFTIRLAQAHGVLLGDLLTYIIFPLTQRSRLQRQTAQTNFWMKEARALNGVKGWARDWVAILQHLTDRDDLLWLTLLAWKDLLYQNGLTRPWLAWCPSCYETWRNQEQVIYDPLVWSLAIVTICPLHARPLQTTCPLCQRVQPHLSYRSLSGHCYHCRSWLGINSAQDADSWEEDGTQRWHAEVAGTLLAVMPQLKESEHKETFATKITELVTAKADGRLLEVERRTGVKRATLRGWQQGNVVPQLDMLLTFCQCLSIHPLSLLLNRTPNDALLAVSDQQPGRQLRGRYRKVDLEDLRVILQNTLANEENPPPSMREIGRRLDFDPRYLSARLPVEAKAISSRFLEFQREQREQRLQNICSEVEAVTYFIHHQGEYPSQEKVSAKLNKPGIMWESVARQTWRATLKTLGYHVEEWKIELESR